MVKKLLLNVPKDPEQRDESETEIEKETNLLEGVSTATRKAIGKLAKNIVLCKFISSFIFVWNILYF